MSEDVKRHLRSCAQCQVHDPGGLTAKSPVRNLEAIQPFEAVEMDIVGPIHPITPRGNKYIISATDIFARWNETSPTASAGTADVLAFLTDRIFNRFGLPLCILTTGELVLDKDSPPLWDGNIKHIRASVQHPKLSDQKNVLIALLWRDSKGLWPKATLKLESDQWSCWTKRAFGGQA